MVLRALQEKWRSDDPRDKYLSLFGKLTVELGTAALLAVIIYLPFAYIGLRYSGFEVLANPGAALTTIGAIAAYLGNQVFCTVISRDGSDLDQVIGEVFGGEKENSDQAVSTEEL